MILHGAGSAKESHFDFARGCRADGIAALAYDARGHGRSAGEFGPGAIDDALALVELLRGHAGPVALRGSSMGGFQAIHAGARDPSLCAVVAICPAPEDILLRGLRSQQLQHFRCDVPATERWLESLDLYEAAAALGPGTALLLLHARGDEQIPWTVSEELLRGGDRAEAAARAARAATTARSSTTSSCRPSRAASSSRRLRGGWRPSCRSARRRPW